MLKNTDLALLLAWQMAALLVLARVSKPMFTYLYRELTFLKQILESRNANEFPKDKYTELEYSPIKTLAQL